MVESNKPVKKENTEVVVKQENNCQLEEMQYKKNEATFNYNGITLNIDIPIFIGNVKKFREKREMKKAIKRIKKEQQKINTENSKTINIVNEENKEN